MNLKHSVFILFLVLTALACFSSISIANENSHNYDNAYQDLSCDSLSISAQIDKCIQKNLVKSYEIMIEAIEQWKNEIIESYQPAPELGMKLIALFDTEQALWEAFRDTSCAREAFEIESTSVVHLTTVNECKTSFNQARTEQIK